MKVPKQFELYGATIKVVRRSPEHFHSNCTYGEYDDDAGVIAINRHCPPRYELQTFLHEYFHAALTALGYHNESANERLVDGLASTTVQLLKTAKSAD